MTKYRIKKYEHCNLTWYQVQYKDLWHLWWRNKREYSAGHYVVSKFKLLEDALYEIKIIEKTKKCKRPKITYIEYNQNQNNEQIQNS